ncbi:hypothetical protein SAMN04488090_0617 [Siphonobacter aquaeclarae]|uniref:Uncharacterized protein n=1 Tax=Siphonobacter aquaeclarae TaxID=563176 RepID=A0A1G9ITN5_9BACT|nr:hypothetical protein SAMN04488090_0617 [Siphonobacter aquaeclarae]
MPPKVGSFDLFYSVGTIVHQFGMIFHRPEPLGFFLCEGMEGIKFYFILFWESLQKSLPEQNAFVALNPESC